MGAKFVMKMLHVFSDLFFWASISCEASIWHALKTIELKSQRKEEMQQSLRNLPIFSWWDLESHRMPQKPGSLWGKHCEVERKHGYVFDVFLKKEL